MEMNLIYSTLALQNAWLNVCLNKFEACFTSKAALANAFNARESIVIDKNGKKSFSSITETEVDVALEEIDEGNHVVFSIRDMTRHGSVLINRFGLELFNKMSLNPSDILIFEAAFFYSCSDDCYVVNLHDRHDPRPFEIYFEKSINDNALHYSIRNFGQTYSGHIDERLLSDIHLEKYNAAEFTQKLPELLQIIASIEPSHVEQNVTEGFMQHYQKLMENHLNDENTPTDIVSEKKTFLQEVDRAVTQRIGLKIYDRYRRILMSLFDSNIHADLLMKLTPHVSDRSFTSFDELKLSIEQLITLIHEENQMILQQLDVFYREKALLELKMEEGLPPLLKMYVETNLQAVNEVAAHSNLSLVATGLLQTVRQVHEKIQEETENAKNEMDRLSNILESFMRNDSISNHWKIKIQEHLQKTKEPFSLVKAKIQIDCMKKCQFDLEKSYKQQTDRHLSEIGTICGMLTSQIANNEVASHTLSFFKNGKTNQLSEGVEKSIQEVKTAFNSFLKK